MHATHACARNQAAQLVLELFRLLSGHAAEHYSRKVRLMHVDARSIVLRHACPQRETDAKHAPYACDREKNSRGERDMSSTGPRIQQ
jgi:hypothetical protein